MKYQCQICGYIHDEEKEGKSFKELKNVLIANQMCLILK